MGKPMDIVARMDEFGKPAWITAMVAGFIVFWPIGLAILAYLIWSGRMGSWKCCNRRSRARPANFSSSSGNTAFDEYRAQTLMRLEEEQKEFQGFLDRLRAAKDKAEFDQFMADQRAGASEPTDPRSEPPPAGAIGEPSPAG